MGYFAVLLLIAMVVIYIIMSTKKRTAVSSKEIFTNNNVIVSEETVLNGKRAQEEKYVENNSRLSSNDIKKNKILYKAHENSNEKEFYEQILKGIEDGIVRMKTQDLTVEVVYKRLERFKYFNYLKLSDDEIFWILTYVMFFNLGKKASMIEKKLPNLKRYLYGYKRLSKLNQVEIDDMIVHTGFGKQINWCIQNSKEFGRIINKYGSFQKYLLTKFNIKDTYCSNESLNVLYMDMQKRFIGIGETAGWHLLTELGFFSLKPDKVIRRIFYRLGLISNENDMQSAIEVGRNISALLNIPIRYIDILFVKYGQVGQSDVLGTIDGICTEINPKCDICKLNKICHFNSNTTAKSTNLCINSYKETLHSAKIDMDRVKYDAIEQVKNYDGSKFSDANKFQLMYAKSSQEIKKAFDKLIAGVDSLGIKNFPTNTPDYRLQKRYNFCLIKFINSENCIRIHLRTDGINLLSNKLLVKNNISHSYNGKTWAEIKVKADSEIQEALRLINEVYVKSD